MKVAILRIHPAPYREPVLRRLVEDVRFTVESFSIVGEDGGHAGMGLGSDRRPLAGVRHLADLAFGDGIRLAIRLLRRFVFSRDYSCVVWPAYCPWWLTLPILASAISGRRYAVSLDTVRDTSRFVGRAFKRLIFRRAAFLWVPGQAARRYLREQYGIPAEKIVTGLYLPESFPIPHRLCTGGPITFLMVANHVPNRRMEVLADGFRAFATRHEGVRLVLCGKGVAPLAGGAVEVLEGGCAWPSLPELYAQAAVYVHTGEEQFSTALLMGAMAELPLLVGAEVGVCADLFAQAGEKPGLTVDGWRDPECWREAFERMWRHQAMWPKMGVAARRCAAAFSVERTARAVGAALMHDTKC